MNGLTMYERVLGKRYSHLPAAVQRFHRLTGHSVLFGWVETLPPASVMARVFAFCLGTPNCASSGPMRFELKASEESESWIRHFPTRTTTSTMRLVTDQLEERLGAARLSFRLTALDGALNMELVRLRFFGVPCPQWLMPTVVAKETGDEDQLHFQVAAALPLVGVVASYRGHLDVGPKAST